LNLFNDITLGKKKMNGIWEPDDLFEFLEANQKKTGKLRLESEWGKKLQTIAQNEEWETFMEIGTWNGWGTTQCFYQGFLKRNKPFEFYSLENNPDKCDFARKIYTENPNIHILNEIIVEQDNNNPNSVGKNIFSKKNIEVVLLDGDSECWEEYLILKNQCQILTFQNKPKIVHDLKNSQDWQIDWQEGSSMIWRRIKKFFQREDFITTDQFWKAFPESYYKTDVVIHGKSMEYRGQLFHPPPQGMKLLITGHSDYEIKREQVNDYQPKIWWTTNKQTSLVRAYPLGITNDTQETLLHPIYGNLEIMLEVMEEPQSIWKNLVYMNFSIQTYPQIRQAIWYRFQSKLWVTKGISEASLKGRKNFLRELRSHVFVLCPRGNGRDTHRLWETLYMGSIPIVEEDLALEDFRELFPICFVKNWEEVTVDFLIEQEKRIRSRKYSPTPLKMSYWIEKIKKSVE